MTSQEKLFHSIHVVYESTLVYQDDAGRPVESPTGMPWACKGLWARDENGSLALESVQLSTSIPNQALHNEYYVTKDGKRWIHLDRNGSGGLGTGIISLASPIDHELLQTRFVLPWSSLGSMEDFRAGCTVEDVTQDNRKMCRISWRVGTGRNGPDKMTVLLDTERNLMPVLIEHRTSDGQLLESSEVLASVEVGDGLWLPTLLVTHGRAKGLPNGATQEVCTYKIDPLTVNGPLDPKLFQPTWKPGTEVYDRVLKKSFIVLDNATLAASGGDRGVDEALLAINQGQKQRQEYLVGVCSSAPATGPADHAGTGSVGSPSPPLGGLSARQRVFFWGGTAGVFVLFAVIGLLWRRKRAGPEVGP